MDTKLFSTVTVLTALAAMSCGRMAKPDKAGYSGGDITHDVNIIRDKTTKDASLVVDQDIQWELYTGPAVDSIDFWKPVLTGKGAGTFPIDVPNDRRSYFQIVTPNGNAILAERHLPMTGGYNFRDLGGFRTRDGRHVKWGKIFRSDDMHNLTPSDLEYLSSIPIVSVVDFRSDTEIKAAPDKLADSVKWHYLYSITPGDLQEIATAGTLPAEEQMLQAMENVNILLVTNKDAIEQYRKFFSLLQDEEKLPLLFHCTAGKDRTGMGAALFLASLGVDEPTIMEDYLSSNEYLGDKYGSLILAHPELEPLMTVRKEYLQAGLDRIKQDHGSIENYLSGTLGVDLDKMKQIYLYE